MAVLAALAALAAGACKVEALTAAEARVALEEVVLSGQALSLTSGSVEIATNFTIGGAVEAAAEELRAFIASQLPCARITVAGATLGIEYGVNPGNCTYNGHTWSGSHTVTIASAAAGSLVVDHEWDGLSNGVVTVSGTAHVTWSSATSSRTVDHELHWRRLADGREGTGGGHRVQTVLSGGLVEGIRVDGQRYWEGASGRWDLDIDNVEMRWVDPVPQSGTYSLDTPFGKSATLTFSRVDADTIAVTFATGRVDFTFNVTSAGAITDR
jgi:hypothetical protein